MTWCVLISDESQMAGGVKVIGPYRNLENASKAADRINRKIEIHSETMDWSWPAPNAWVQRMRYKVTEFYADLEIQKLEN